MKFNSSTIKISLVLALAANLPLHAHAQQSKGLVVDVNSVSALSKWGRWSTASYLNLGSSDNPGLAAQWQAGDWMFKLHRNPNTDIPDLFFGLKVNEANLGVTSVGCMSQTRRSGQTGAMCGVQLDMNLH